MYKPVYKLVRAGQDDYHYAELVAACPALADVVCVGPSSPFPAALARNVTRATTLAVRSARRWTEIDLGWLVSSETLLPPREDGTPERRVPVLVIEEVGGWSSTRYFTFYPALGPFLDIPPTHIAGALHAAPLRLARPPLYAFRLCRRSELPAIDRHWEVVPQGCLARAHFNG